ncbi:hypothetical protein GCM10010193_29260 [Kitasatospora atroaurantiaca]|uniref:Amino acid adenylation domain-containing protein n=1 Tax=Kitasatospora atroaurantiaca TaxID=285545 RepID=A0A561EIX4_9ACTN|nr:amino acid adenylation domain-containing protein [Kitasatospora atroaurantiaca]TWE15522.1 amino acid adenylation domain-containing protein [Kitasatospora atroaurantiaca]
MTRSSATPPGRPAADLVRPILAAARRNPGLPAVTAPDGTADYCALAARVDLLAREFADRGVGPGSRVGLVLTPGREAVAAALAAMSLGAAYVPLDPQQPAERLRTILANCSPGAVVAEAGPAAGLPGALVPGVAVGPWRQDRTATVSEPAVRADDVAYVVHTSGSTGVPKAVQVEHGGVVNLLRDLDRRAPVPTAFTGSWWTNPSFDVAAWEVWAPLTRGGHLVVVPQENRLEAPRFADHLHRHGVQSAYVPPALLPEFCALLRADRQYCAGLVRLLVGVEPIALGLLQSLCRARPGLMVVNGYGPAETTICCTLHTVSATGGEPHERTPIGTPVAGNRVLLLDERGRVSATGTGELLVVGAGVARGYLHADGASATGFVTAPDGSGERAYRTGDRVTTRPDGELVFVERVDRQLKINGHRIEPGEVETAIRQSARVREVVVGRRELPGAGAALVAYVVPEAGGRWDDRALRAGLGLLLPSYAVPQVILPLPALPQTRHGKTDHAALAALPLPAAPAEAVELAAGTAAVVARAWQAELRHPVLLTAGFAEAGGTSLGAVRVAAALRLGTGRQVWAADVMRAGGIRHLAELLDAAPPARPGAGAGAGTAPLGTTEQGMWFQDKVHAGRGMYAEALCFELPPGVEAERLAKAVAAVCDAHPVLSAAVREQPDGPWMDLSGARPALEERELGEAPDLAELVRRSVDVTAGPLFRPLLCRTPDGQRLLLLVWHHLATDGWSARILLADLARCYDSSVPPDRAGRTICDLMAERTGFLTRPGLPDRVRRAAALLEGTVTPESAVGAGTGLRTGTLAVSLDPTTTAQLSAVAASAGVTPAVVLLAAYEQALCDVLGRSDFPLGVAVTDRAWLDAERTAGCLVDTAVLRGVRRDLTADTALRTLADGLDDLTRPEHRVPLPALVAEVRRAARLRHADFPSCYFSLDEEPELRLGGVRCTPVPVARTGGRFDATLSLRVGPDGVRGHLEHRWRLLTDTAAQQLHGRLLHHLAVLTVAEPAPSGPLSPARGSRPADAR